MAGSKILVLGGTGPAGLCLLRELVFRKHEVVVYARTPSKIPKDLASNPLLEIVKGDMDDQAAMSPAMAKSNAVISLLGPDINRDRGIDPTKFSSFYGSCVIPLMKEHGVRRILLMGTISITLPEDRWTFFHSMVVVFMRTLANRLYHTMQNIRTTFEKEASDLDWTIFRIAQIPGESDEESWRRDRDDGEVFAGMIGEKGWTSSNQEVGIGTVAC
ncbi:hypothetical protein NEMBOFW57_008062 [Staphylotrichum longicolle]|uniref:NAD(P)-binding domain-containing protein n=1 Tax=Staphylotrichum longicolle TaxID=669026 RepID=A0AAD4HYK8_9PEZI|nr:hypothetical protein NEMBOFW57_008062 [Staphylotrichum longicolle]